MGTRWKKQTHLCHLEKKKGSSWVTNAGLCKGTYVMVYPQSATKHHTAAPSLPVPAPCSWWDGEENRERRQNSWVEIRTI